MATKIYTADYGNGWDLVDAAEIAQPDERNPAQGLDAFCSVVNCQDNNRPLQKRSCSTRKLLALSSLIVNRRLIVQCGMNSLPVIKDFNPIKKCYLFPHFLFQRLHPDSH
ncbi:MAG: hypothetical protein EBZ49_06555 [Proteobacteria bacterium]|nr:hypothetical protein [Pseudomonadota bacterium]